MHRLAKLSLANRSVVALVTLIIAAFGVMSMTIDDTPFVFYPQHTKQCLVCDLVQIDPKMRCV